MPNITQSIKDNISITEYAERCGYHVQLVHEGRWTLAEHDSMNINLDPVHPGRQRFIWNSQGVSGSVIDFAMAVRGLSKEDAIHDLRDILCSRSAGEWEKIRQATQSRYAPIRAAPAALQLPEQAAGKPARIYAYLCKTRGLDPKVLSQLSSQKLLYQDTRGNAVFVGMDYDKQAKYCCYRGTLSDVSYRGEARGSKKEVGFSMGLVGEAPIRLMVCEAPIDAISLATMLNTYGRDSTQFAYLALGGTAPNALLYHLEHQPQLQTIYLCQDNDEAGATSRAKCRELLQQHGFTGRVIDKPPIGKDFNEDLLVLRSVQAPEQTQQQAAASNTAKQPATQPAVSFSR